MTGPFSGRLIGVGVGPGAPDLVTLRAARCIEAAKILAYPALPGAESFARRIVADLIPKDAEELVIGVPMSRDRAPAQAAYDAGAEQIAARLESGRDVVVLCEGDPFLYGSFMYLHARLAPRFAVEVVPGVSSVVAAGAMAGLPLSARNEVFSIVPAPLPDAEIAARLAADDSIAILKLGRHLPKLRRLIAAAGLTETAIYAERVTLEAQRICPLTDAPETAPYFSMILIVKGADPWL